MKGKWKYGCLAPFVVLGPWLFTIWLGSVFPRTIASAVREDNASRPCRYEILQDRWQRDGITIRIAAVDFRVWPGMEVVRRYPNLELVSVTEERWLPSCSAAVLRLRYRFSEDSLRTEDEMGILVDLTAGETYEYFGRWGSSRYGLAARV